MAQMKSYVDLLILEKTELRVGTYFTSLGTDKKFSLLMNLGKN